MIAHPHTGPSSLAEVRFCLEETTRHAKHCGLHELAKVLDLLHEVLDRGQDRATAEIEMLIREMNREPWPHTS